MEVKTGSEAGAADVLGWRVSLSRRVWQQCVTTPKGANGQTEGSRLHDLLQHLRFNLKRMATLRRERISAGFGFSVNVVNDDRNRSEFLDGLESPGDEIPVTVFASFDEDGGPLLVVLAQSEAPPLRIEEHEYE
jgi:hypothetical protein